MKSTRVRPRGHKHIPQRTCIACRQVQPKRELVRLVRTADGEVEMDPTGKMRGRGAYLCRREGCWQQLLQGNRLEYALRSKLTPYARERLAQYSPEFVSQQSSSPH